MKEAKAKSFKNVYAKKTDAGIERLRTLHLNDEAETEIEKEEVVHGTCVHMLPRRYSER